MNATTITLKNGELVIQGELTQQTVMEALRRCEALFSGQQSIQLNLSGVSRCDSASLAFLTALLRKAKQQHLTLKFIHLPKQLKDLSTVSGLDDIFPIVT